MNLSSGRFLFRRFLFEHLSLGYRLGAKRYLEYSDQLSAKDEKIIHDYSKQRCNLNQTSSGEPLIWALLVWAPLVGAPLVGVQLNDKDKKTNFSQLFIKKMHFETNHIGLGQVVFAILTYIDH